MLAVHLKFVFAGTKNHPELVKASFGCTTVSKFVVSNGYSFLSLVFVNNHFISKIIFFCRFPQLFPPLKPEVVAQRTVDAVRADKAFLYLPWTMHALVILKR